MTEQTEGAPRRMRRRRPKKDAQPSLLPETETPPASTTIKSGDNSAATTPAKSPPAAKEPFATAPHQAGFPKAPDMQRGFQTIVTDLFESGYDITEEWQEIREGLVIKDALTPARLKTAANVQEDIADRAHQLYIVGKVEVSAYMRETEATYGAIRDSAIQELEKQKANKTRTKQITDADARSEAARLYPDEWSDICTRRERAEAMLLQLQNLAALAKSRCYTVSNMLAPGNRSV